MLIEIEEEQKTTQEESFRTIGEVARELEIPQHVLRFWETKFKQIKPVKRKGGHRYYSSKDVDFIKDIKALLYERGFTIKGAQKYLSGNAAEMPVIAASSEHDGQQDLFVSAIAAETSKKYKEREEKRNTILMQIKNQLSSLRDQLRKAITK